MKEIFRTIETYGMIHPGEGIVAGISGGADSVCLLYALTEYRKQVDFPLTAVHVEHGIRGEESRQDADFTLHLCRNLQVPCQVVHADVRHLADVRGISVEEAGRMARYEIFDQVCRETGAKRIAVAHNQNDQAETVLWNLARGSGLKGLGGIRPVRGNIIRPLLFTSRQKIEEILQAAGFSWCTDRTNLTREYTRNRIRLSILPEMERELNVRTVPHIARAAAQLQQVQAFVEQETDRAEQLCIAAHGPGEYKIALQDFLGFPELVQTELLHRVLGKCAGGLKDIGRVHVESLMKLAYADCGKEVQLPGGIRAVREYKIIRMKRGYRSDAPGQDVFRDGKAVPEPLPLEAPGEYRVPGWRIRMDFPDLTPELFSEIRSEKKYTKWLSYDTIKGNLLLRNRLPGDYLVVNHSGGRKKLKDYFIDLKIPKDQRDRLWLVADGSHILWIPGYRISEAAKVGPETEKVIRIRMEEETDAGKDKDFNSGRKGE